MERQIDYVPLLQMVQEYISSRYAAALTEKDKQIQVRSFTDKFLREKGFVVKEKTTQELIDLLYRDMAEYSVVTPFLDRDNIEEININSWDDMAVTYTNGKIVKIKEHFYSPVHAQDIIKRMLRQSNVTIDKAAPMAQGHLSSNTRVTALMNPLVDDGASIAASIRLLHPSRVNLKQIVANKTGTQRMIDFLAMCIRYGVSLVVAGETSSGKTTLLNALMTSIPDEKRIFTIESGAREFDLVKRNRAGKIVNNVVHTLSRPSDNKAFDITQEDLLVAALRFNPDYIVVGEMRDVEAYSAVEASLTGHTVVSTVHANAADGAHMRMALLCQKRFPIDFNTSLIQVGQAFPIVVYCHKLENNERKIMDISECEILPNGERRYRTLFSYNIIKNEIVAGKTVTHGSFQQEEIISSSLQKRLLQGGVPRDVLEPYLRKGADAA